MDARKGETIIFEEIKKTVDKEDFVCYAYHGTNKENALKISKNGFKVGTHFASHLEDALEFGGSWIFVVKWDHKPFNWQFLNKRIIKPNKIHRLTQYRPIVRIGTQSHLTRKIDSKTEHLNLLGKSLQNVK